MMMVEVVMVAVVIVVVVVLVVTGYQSRVRRGSDKITHLGASFL